jgi:hypothetical protein
MYSIEYLENGIPYIVFESFVNENDVNLILDFSHSIDKDCENIILSFIDLSNINVKVIALLNELDKKIENVYLVMDNSDEIYNLLKEYEALDSFKIYPSLEELIFNTEIEDCFC